MDSSSSPDTSAPALVVDIDGPLIRTDLKDELFWRSISRVPDAMLVKLGIADPDPDSADYALDASLLPYDGALVQYLREQRQEGFRTVLAGGAHPDLAERVAEHLQVFDAVHTGETDDLVATYGDGGYAFADAEAQSPNLASTLPALARAMRPHQWLKNVLIFVPMLTAHAWSGANILTGIAAFIAFSLVASAVYLLNDLVDLSSDRGHPRKRERPFASGALPLSMGRLAIPILLIAGAAIALSVSLPFLGVLAGYFVVTLAYSFVLKQKAIVDICVLAALYTVRIVAGGVALDIGISVWLLAFSMFFFFALASIKRQAELVDGIASGRVKAKGRDYTIDDVALVSQMALASSYVAVLVMALYVNAPGVQQLYKSPNFLWGICLILLYWLSRAVWKTHRGEMHDDPMVFAIKDRISQISVLGVVACAVLGMLF